MLFQVDVGDRAEGHRHGDGRGGGAPAAPHPTGLAERGCGREENCVCGEALLAPNQCMSTL